MTGLYGALIVHGSDELSLFQAAGVSYSHDDEDQWIWQIADWYDVPTSDLLSWYLSPESGGDEPMPDAYTINNMVRATLTLLLSNRVHVLQFNGEFSVTVTDSSSVRLRLINS